MKNHLNRKAIKVSIVGGMVSAIEHAPAPLNGKASVCCSVRYATGEEAMRLVALEEPDVALVDFNLPCMDGFECVRKLKARLPNLPVLMFTREETSHSK